MAKRLTIKDHISETNLFTRRTIILGVGVLVCTLILLSRLVYLQIIQHNLYTTLSKQNQVNLIPIEPNRGLIYDRNGVLLAENIPVFSLEITPDRVESLKQTILRLQKIVPISKDDIKSFYKQLRQKRAFEHIPLRLKLTDTEVAKFSVNQYRFPGVAVRARLIRHYPMNEALSHVLGYVGRINERELEKVDTANYSATNFIGKVGIEKFYEDQLHGSVGYEQVETNASGRIVRVLKRTPPIPGKNLYLSIDSGLETAAEEALGDLRGAVVAIQPNTGEVLALVSSPSYNPNLFVRGISTKQYNKLSKSPDQPLYNRAIRGQYPLASTIKPFLALEGLDTRTVTRAYKIFDPGWYKLPRNSHLYRDWKRGGHGWINVTRAIMVSCDTYFYNLANMMGIGKIDNILTRFGFGISTNIDMGEELPGLVPGPAWKKHTKGMNWYTGDTLISGIGQGYMLTTPLQLAVATAALAEHGIRYQPHLLYKSESADGKFTTASKEQRYPVLLKHKWVWNTVINAMQQVITSREGTGYRFGRNTPYTVAAKTGTAQVFSAKFHEHLDEKNLPMNLRDHSLFIAFAPVDNPKIAIAVVVENSSKAANIARKVMDYYLIPQKQPSTVKPVIKTPVKTS